MAEKRTDPDDGVAYTFEELAAYYKGKYKQAVIDEYWKTTCTPAGTDGKAKAKAKAKRALKVQAKAEPEAAEPEGAAGREAKADPKARAKREARKKGARAEPKGAAERRPRRAAVVVDPYSSGKYLLLELNRRRLQIICVRSSTKLSHQFLRSHEANSRYFAEMVDFETLGSFSELVDIIKAMPYQIVGVFGGSEPGVELADRLADALAMPHANSLELLTARKDKAEMQEALRRNGVEAAEQFKSGDLEELLGWARRRGQWPLVAKPTGGAGSDGVFFCKSEEDLTAAHNGIIGACNPTGKVNTEIALQEFLVGDEYIVDTVSHEGKHLCVAMWVYTKRKGLPWDPQAIMSEGNQMIPATGEKQDALIDYVFRVLDAVGLRFGPCHTEVMFTPRGPVLVEVNARLHGLQGPRLIELATGISKATHAADVILGGGDLFHKLYQEGRPGRYLYPLKQQCTQMVLCSSVEGYLLSSIKDMISDMNLPSIVEILPAVEVGQFINQSRDLPTSAGTVLMVHESMDQIKKDIRKIRQAEEAGTLYQVSPEPLECSQPLTLRRRSRVASLDLELPSEALRSRLDSLEKVDELWAAMNERPL